MASLIVVGKSFKICSLLFLLLFSYFKKCGAPDLTGDDIENAELLLHTATNILIDSFRRIDDLEYIKQNNQNTAQFEVGYVYLTIHEKYRRMVDKYNTSITMKGKLYTMELVMFLEEIELHFWEIDHLSNMMHELELKFGINTSLHIPFHELTSAEVKIMKATSIGSNPYEGMQGMGYWKGTTKKKKRFVLSKYLVAKLKPTTKQITRWWWPLEYGWEIDYYW